VRRFASGGTNIRDFSYHAIDACVESGYFCGWHAVRTGSRLGRHWAIDDGHHIPRSLSTGAAKNNMPPEEASEVTEALLKIYYLLRFGFDCCGVDRCQPRY
jgi:hypothetical protein